MSDLRSTVSRLPALPLLFAGCISLPLLLPIPGLETVPPFAMAAALLSIPVLFVQLSLDAGRWRSGSSLRLGALTMVVAAVASWLAGMLTFGVNSGAMLSLLNWIALAAIVIAAQTFLGAPERIRWMIDTWLVSHTIIAGAVLIFLVGTYGTDIVGSTDRSATQLAMRAVIPSWPNYFGVSLAVAVCIAYGRLLAGTTGVLVKIQFAILLCGLIVTFSRGSYVACVAGIVVMTFVSGSRLRAMLMLLGAAVATVAAIAFVPAVSYQFLASFEPGTSQNLGLLERLAFMREALILVSEHPVFGIGFLRFADFADPTLVYSGADLPASQLGSVHNEFVTILLKGGVVGAASLVLFATLAWRVLRRAVRHHDFRIRQLGIVAFGVAGVMFAAGFALESLRTISVSGMAWALIGGLDGAMYRSILPHPKASENGESLRLPSY